MNPHYPSNESALSPNGRFGRLSYLGWNMLMTFSLLIIIGIIAAFSPGLFMDSSALAGSSMVATVLIGLA